MAEIGKIAADEEVVNNKDQEGGGLQKDDTWPSHYENENHAPGQVIMNLQGGSTYDPSPADGYTHLFTQICRGEQEEGVSESKSTTPSNSTLAPTSDQNTLMGWPRRMFRKLMRPLFG